MATAVGAIGLGTSLAGGLLSAYGAEKEGQSTQQMYNYQAQVAKINADIDRQNSDWALHKGDVEGQQYGMKAGQQQAQIRTGLAASGLDVNSGSAAEVQRSNRDIIHMDEATIRDNASKVAYDYRVKATQDEDQAKLYTMAGANAAEAGGIKAMGSLIGTAGSVSSKWLQGKQMGLWGGNIA